MDKYEDEPQLLDRSRQGDLAAFNTLVERYQGRVYNLCLRMLASPQAAEDVTQEAFIAAFRAIRAFHGEAFRAWLFRIAANACYDDMRRRRARPAASLDEPLRGEERSIDPAAPGPSLDEIAEQQELGRAIQDALGRLHPDQRIAVVLCDVRGLDYAEIAAALNISLGTVKSRIFRGRHHLRQLLQETGGELLPDRLRQSSEKESHEPLH